MPLQKGSKFNLNVHSISRYGLFPKRLAILDQNNRQYQQINSKNIKFYETKVKALVERARLD